MIDPQALRNALALGFRPLPGRCLIEMDTIPTMAGLLHVPDSARELRTMSHVKGKTVYGDSSWTGKVLSMTPRRRPEWPSDIPTEDFSVGDKVLILLLEEDLNQEVICTHNTRVYAVLPS